LGNTSYYLSGEIPSELEGRLNSSNNYWDPAPETYYFDVTEGDVSYTPTEDGSSGNRSFNTYDLVSIGFGLYDTIYINDQSENPLAANLFINAVTYENHGNYSDAIEDYKEIVSLKDSIYMRYSVPRIYNCYEKANFFGSGISAAITYFSELMNDTTLPNSIRAVSGDLYLKTNFRNFNYPLPISEYNSLYINNPNTPLGLHGLLNKTIIESLSGVDTTDNMSMSNNYSTFNSHKGRIFSMLGNHSTLKKNLVKNEITDPKFGLAQNYPNPFNPVTMINFNIPTNAKVTLRIYDMLGREITKLIDQNLTGGNYSIQFDGSSLSSGVYFYSLYSVGENGDIFSSTKRMVLLK
jgi:tetratricopeptide (TPR) repeat protein